MAVKPFSKEQLNFFKFSTLVLDEFPKVLRQIFITMWDSKVAVRPGFIPWDDSTTVRNLLLKSEGGKTDIPTTKSIEEWDCTALFKATVYAKTFGVPGSKGSTLNDLYLKKVKPLPGSFHSSVQSLTGNQDETYALAIDQLRLLRNTVCHSPKPEIIKNDFDNYVKLVTNALTAVNVDNAIVDTIGQMSEDDFPTEKVHELQECLLKELRANSVFHEQKLSSIDERTENLEEKLSVIGEQTDEIHTKMQNSSLREKKIVPESLPKSYIPSSVPWFTGREGEIEEITNLITGQSTRLLNIWGSSGFGKTSTAIEVAHHLGLLDSPVYFFKLQDVSTVDEFLSKILSIFKSNLVDLNLRHIDRLVSIFREISSRIFLIFDNLDDLLSSESSSAKLIRLFLELLDSNVNINIVFTTRELLENMRNQTGFRDIRIRPLHPDSSVQFVRQLLPLFSESIVANVARISSNVPLAMKVIASLIEYVTEDMAINILEELSLSGNLLEQIDRSYEQNMKKLFETPFEQLTLSDKHTLISLTVFSSGRISKNAAVDVISDEMGYADAVLSLKTLVRKSLIDEDREYYSIHPLIHSFVVDKAKRSDLENVFQSSRIRFSRYYLLLFERINDDFLSGKSVDSPQLQDAIKHLSITMLYFTTSTCSLEDSQDLIRILSKSEIFLFLIALPSGASLHIPELYDFAIEKCRTQQYNYPYSKLHISKYFRSLATFSSKFEYLEIPEHIREDVMLLSDGSAAKLGCYEGISMMSRGNIKAGIECIEKHVVGLQNCADQLLTKCLCLQILALFYTDSKEYSKSSKLSREAIEVCKEIGNYNLFLIGDCDDTLSMTQRESKGEQLIVFVYLLFRWSNKILSDETQLHFLNFVVQLEQQLENKAYSSQYLFQILTYSDCLLAILGVRVGQEVLLDEKITFLEKSMMSDDCCSLTDRTFTTRSDMSVTRFSARLLNCYNFQILNEKKQGVSVDKCRHALDLSLKQHGKQHWNTAVCYLNMGLAENDAENYISALNAFEHAFEIMTTNHDGSSSSNADLAEVHIGKGESYHSLKKFESAAASFDEALRIKRKLFGDDTEEIAQILVLLGQSQLRFNDLSSGLATVEQALQIWKTLYPEKPSSDRYIVGAVKCYYIIGQVHNALGNITESIKCVKTALEVSTDCDQECSAIQSLICVLLIDLKVDENLYTELLESSLRLMKKNHRPFLPMLYLRLGLIQVESGKYKAGLASLQEALDIELDITLRSNLIIRKLTVFCYISVLKAFNNIEKFKLSRKVIDRATQIAESLPEGSLQHLWIFRCYRWKGHIQNKTREYITAIVSLKHALLQLPKISHESCDKLEEFECHWEIAKSHFYVRSYKDALTSLYDALSVIKGRFPEGSVLEAEVYRDVATVAQKMKNKILEVSNLRLAYKMYSNVLGETHSNTQVIYNAYARALGLG